MPKAQKQLDLVVGDKHINVLKFNDEDFFSLTDMVMGHGEGSIIEKWLSTKDTIEFLGVWEQMHNPNFNSPEFGGIKNDAGTNRFTLSVKKWVKATGAIGIRAKTGRYNSGTFAHKDIAFEFASYISPILKLLIIKDYERLKSLEAEKQQWDFRRLLSKANYKIQTNAIGSLLNNARSLSALQKSLIYANEADILNKIVFGLTASDWKSANPILAKGGNQRDHGSIKQLLILNHLESINANMINRHMARPERIKILVEEARRQNRALGENVIKDSVKKLSANNEPLL